MARPKAALKAEGIGIPKLGNKIFSSTSFDTRNMLKIATRMQEVEQTLFTWWSQRQKTNRLAELLRSPPARTTPEKNLGFGDSQHQTSMGSSAKKPRLKK